MADFRLSSSAGVEDARTTPYRVRFTQELPQILLMAALVAGAILIYPRLPDRIPTHWALNGTVTGVAVKSWLRVMLLPGLTVAFYLVMLFGPFRDPNRHKYGSFSGAYLVARYVLTAFMCVLSAAVLLAQAGVFGATPAMTSAGLSALLVALGPVVGRLGPNHLVGLRVPWTLRSEAVWRQTHRTAGPLLVAAGAVGFAAAFLPPPWPALILPVLLVAAGASLTVYSYRLAERERTRGAEKH